MKRCLAVTFAICAVFGLVQPGGPVAAQNRATATNVPVIPHEVVPDFFKNPPGIYTGENMGIATNSKGNVYIYHRAYETRLFEYSALGDFIREIGRNNYGFAFAHSVRVDAQDNIWAVDEGTDMLVKFAPDGCVLMTIGRREDPVRMLANMPGGGVFHGRNEKYKFGRQTDVAFDQQGNIFVSDGYNNSRVAKFDKNGNWVKAIGERGSQPNQFNTPHGITSDAKGNIYVADRGNRRVQVYDPDLNPVRIIEGMGAPWTVCTNPGATQYLFSGDGNGKIYKFSLDGKLIGWAQTSLNHGQSGCLIHELHCESETVLYKGDCSTWTVEKITIAQ